MSAEEDQQSQSGYDEQAGGPGAPTPLGALEVCMRLVLSTCARLTMRQGVAGLSKRDIQLFIDAGYNTVESVAYT
jgi:DNA repair protein RAD51